MQTISQGTRGAEVTFLQRLLNKHGANPALVEDGFFGNLTKNAVTAYQTTKGVPANGIVTDIIWKHLGLRFSHHHRVTLVGQQNSTTCWTTAATMLLSSNMSVSSGNARIVPGGGLGMGINNIETFVGGLGWRLINRQSSPSANVLISALARGPIWVALHHPVTNHAVVFNAVFTDGDPSGDGTVFSVCDPYPVGRGSIYGTSYINREVILSSVQSRPSVMIQYVAGP